MSKNKPVVIATATSDGTSLNGLAGVSLLVRAVNGSTGLAGTTVNKGDIGVVDFVTFAYDNSASGDAAFIDIRITPYGASSPIWRALATVPAGETTTIDKTFEGGLPLWTGTNASASSTDPVYIFGPNDGYPAQSGITAAATFGIVSVYINGISWIGTEGGVDTLSVGYHAENPASRRS